MSTEKIYCGSAKIIPTQYGDLTKIIFHKDDIQKMLNNMNGDWINLVVKEKQNKVEGKPTHYLEVDTWKPDNSNQGHSIAPKMNGDMANDFNDSQGDGNDLPF